MVFRRSTQRRGPRQTGGPSCRRAASRAGGGPASARPVRGDSPLPRAGRCARVRTLLHGPHHGHHPAVHRVPGAVLPDGVQAQLHLPERVLQGKLLHSGGHLLGVRPHGDQQRQVGPRGLRPSDARSQRLRSSLTAAVSP